jgi:DNA repair exonuclease SbcCD ATPase subunit
MTPESREFVSTARKFFAQFAGFFAEVEELEKIDQLVREGEARVAALRAQDAQATSAIARRHEAADVEIATKRCEVDVFCFNQIERASQTLDDAHAKAAQILSDAQTTAAGLADEAHAHERAIEERRQELAGLRADIASHEDFRDQAKADAAAAREQHDKEREALRAFRASLPQ